MKTELHTTLAGEFSLEVIAETDFERGFLERAWALRSYPKMNGQTVVPGKGTIGFYIPLFAASVQKS